MSRARNESIDVLRGVAILGTFASNIWIFTTRHTLPAASSATEHSGLDPTHFAPLSHWRSLDGALALVVECLCNGKFLALLSILFGVGMCAQYESALRHGLRWPWRYYWRTTLLLLDGALHHVLVVEFDILMGYAVTAFVVAPLLRLKGRALALVASAIAALHITMESLRAHEAVRTHGASLLRDDAALELLTATGATYTGQVRVRWEHFWAFRVEALVIAPPLSATLFLLGAALWRAGIFTPSDRSTVLRKRLALVGFCVGLPLTVLPTLEILPLSVNLALTSLSRYTIAPVLALGYLGAGLFLVERASKVKIRAALARLGRASLSVYMLQNILCSVLFYRWGLGLAPLDSVATMLSWLAMSAVLTGLAWLWFERFDQGPFERVWRKLSDAPFTRREAPKP
ncbi:MAG: DUF418 domain-containing protein [Myxococcales bacterium]|nr:DUF418 domain-containing protein [Myxococcales bacterium]